MNRTHRRFFPLSVTLAVALAIGLPTAHAQGGPTGDGVFYYEIGGGMALREPANKFATTYRVPVSAGLAANYSCLQFDPLASTTAAFNEVITLYENIDDIFAAGLAALPMYILQRVNPGLYDLLQNQLLRAEELVRISTKTCQQMEWEVAHGKNPYEDWVTVSRAQDWKAVIGAGGADVVSAEAEIDANVGKNGVTWVCGQKAGGEGDPPISVVGDVTRAGWNIHMGRPPCSPGAAPGGAADEPRLTQVYPSPESAAEYMTKAVGDMIIRTADAPDETRPGLGLLPHYDDERTVIDEALRELVDGALPPTLDNLATVSAPGTFVTRQVVESIQALDPSEREIMITKLSGQLALERTVEKALLGRRMLLTGMRDPNVNASPAPEQLQPFLAELEREVDDLLFETRVRREMSSHTAEILLRDDNRRRAESRGLIAPHNDLQPIDEGAVRLVPLGN